MLTPKELFDKSNYIAKKLSGIVRDTDLNEFKFLCQYGEFDQAYDVLCTQIYEFDIKISREVFELLKDMCRYYKLDDHYWKNMENLIID